MARYKDYCQDQSYFVVLDSNTNYPKGSFVRFLNNFIDEHVELKKFEVKRNNDETGAPAKHARMMLKIIFYAFSQGIYSMRDLAKNYLGKHLDFIFLSGNQTVNHATLSRFISNYLNEITEIFTQTFFIAHSMGYITKKLVAIDGCKLKANASKKFTGDYELFKKKKELYEKMIKNLLSRSLRVEEQENKGIIDKEEAQNERTKIKRLEKNYTNSMARIDTFLKECEQENKKERINLTDNDSGLMHKDNKYFQGYNCQIGVNDKGILVMNDVTSSASDRNYSEKMIGKAIESLKRNNYNGDEIKRISFLLDKGYNNSSTIGKFIRDGYKILIPSIKRSTIEECKRIESYHCKIWKEGNWHMLECPGGIVKSCEMPVKEREHYFYKFFFYKSECLECKYYYKCSELVKNDKKFTVKREVFDNLEEIELLKARLEDSNNLDLYNKRLGMAEAVFGTTTSKRGFDTFFVRGIEKVKCYWSMVCSAYNLRRIHSMTYG